MKRINEQI